jgi:RNA polymerase sigma factor (sigma-70 family)
MANSREMRMGRGLRRGDDLCESARRGESWALTEVWHRYSPAVTGYFRGNESDLRTFVFSVAHARYVDDRRRVARRGIDAEFVAADHGSVAESAEAEALHRLATQRAVALIETLSPDQRDVLLLRIVADLSLEETARVLGKKIGAVKSLQHRGLAALRPTVEQAVSK